MQYFLQIGNFTGGPITPSIDIGDSIMAILTLFMLIVAWKSLKSANNATRTSNKNLEESNRLTNESLELTRNELKTRMIPLFQFLETETKLETPPGSLVVHFTAKILNYGTVPARKIKVRQFKSNKANIEEIVKEIDDKSFSEFHTIQHGGYYEYSCDVPWEKGEVDTNWVISFEYDYLDVQKENTVVVFEGFKGNEKNLKHQWYIHKDVNEAIKKKG